MGQWESRHLVRAILDGDVAARDDPGWAGSGAADPDQYEFWSWRCCGPACLRSVLLARFGDAPGTVTLALELLAAGGYRLQYPPTRRSDGLSAAAPEGVQGLIYQPSVTYLADRWQIDASVAPDLPIDELVSRVGDGQWVMASVHPDIRRPEAHPPSRGGHLVLVHGVASTAEGRRTDLVLHNPSGDSPANQADVRIAADNFDRFFARRGVVFE